MPEAKWGVRQLDDLPTQSAECAFHREENNGVTGMNKTILEQHLEDELQRDRIRSIGNAIGTFIVILGKLTVFYIIFHFALKYW